jgi:hypothetical protein
MFVNDANNIKAIDCYVGDSSTSDQSCTDEGVSGSTSSTTTPTSGPVTASGTAAEIASKLLTEWGNNLTGTDAVKQDLIATSQGKTIDNSDTCGNTVSIDANLLQVLLTTTTQYKLYLDNIITGHGCDQFLHPKGRASDIGTATDISSGQSTNFTPGSSNDNQQLDHSFYVYLASILPKGGEMGQGECAGRTGITAPPGITFFNDTCTHQHVDMGNP